MTEAQQYFRWNGYFNVPFEVKIFIVTILQFTANKKKNHKSETLLFNYSVRLWTQTHLSLNYFNSSWTIFGKWPINCTTSSKSNGMQILWDWFLSEMIHSGIEMGSFLNIQVLRPAGSAAQVSREWHEDGIKFHLFLLGTFLQLSVSRIMKLPPWFFYLF